MIGKSGSYATVAPTQNYLGQALSNIEDNAFKYRQEKRLQEQQEAEKQEKDLARQDADYKESRASTKIDLSGYNFVDNPLQKFSSDSFVAITDVKNQLRNTTDRATRDNLLSKQYKIEQNIEVAKQLPILLKEKGDFIEKNIKDLDGSSINEVLKVFKAFEQQNYITELDENGVANVILYETDDKGQRNVIDKKPLADLIKGIKPYFKSKQPSILAQAIKNTGTQTTVLPNGQYQETRIRPTEEAVKNNSENYANTLINDENELYALSKRANIPMSNVEGLKKAAVNEFKDAVSTTFKKDFDSAKVNALKPPSEGKKSKEEEKVLKPSFGSDVLYRGDRHSGGKVVIPARSRGAKIINVEVPISKTIKDIVEESIIDKKGNVYLRIVKVNDEYSSTSDSENAKSSGVTLSSKSTSTDKTKEKIINLQTDFDQGAKYLDAMGKSLGDLKSELQAKFGNEFKKDSEVYAKRQAQAKSTTPAKQKTTAPKAKAKKTIEGF